MVMDQRRVFDPPTVDNSKPFIMKSESQEKKQQLGHANCFIV